MGLLRLIGNRDIEITVGKGSPGQKTLGLRNDKKNIQAAGFRYPINAALTPKFLQRRLLDANVKPTDDRTTVRQKLKGTPFNRTELDEVKDALAEFPAEARRRLIIRSDESAEGNGLLVSRKICFPSGFDTLDAIVTGIETAVTDIMVSEYTDQVRLYKKITETDTNTGVLIMPIYGEEFVDLESTSRSSRVEPVYGLNYLGPYNRRSLLAPFSEVIELDHLGIVHSDGTIVKIENNSLMELLHAITGLPPPRFRRSLVERIMRLVQRVGPRYLELVKDEWGSHDFVVVQSAPFSCPSIERPDSAKWKTDVRTKLAFGTARADISECRHMSFEISERGLDLDGLKAYDAAHKGYLLLAEKMTAGVILSMLYERLNIVNAGAIVIYQEETRRLTAFSHLGGFFRTLGIPILIIDNPPSFLEKARREHEIKVECAIYANQFERNGILSVSK
ncbi:hypothetical protein HZC08_02385 [Candidatus Micrarchaeota archaeon]|nr:hypothetical protein [Candidatus Micrarchaeota archaeon]